VPNSAPSFPPTKTCHFQILNEATSVYPVHRSGARPAPLTSCGEAAWMAARANFHKSRFMAGPFARCRAQARQAAKRKAGRAIKRTRLFRIERPLSAMLSKPSRRLPAGWERSRLLKLSIVSAGQSVPWRAAC
jgi:hypothetical protein